MNTDKLLAFLCSGVVKKGSAKPSYRMALELVSREIAEIGDLSRLSSQRNAPQGSQRKMIFINECRSGCVKLMTQGFSDDSYHVFDISSHGNLQDFDLGSYLQLEVFPVLREKWQLEHTAC